MVIERLTWSAKFGRGDTVTEAFRTWRATVAPRYGLKARVMTDLSGPMFTVVVETEYRDLGHVSEVAAVLESLYGEAEFQEWFSSWQDCVETGTRDLFR